MARRITGLTFIFIAAMLYVGRFITAALIKNEGPSTPEWFDYINSSVIGHGYTMWNLAALIIGVFYLVLAELDAAPKRATQAPEQEQETASTDV